MNQEMRGIMLDNRKQSDNELRAAIEKWLAFNDHYYENPEVAVEGVLEDVGHIAYAWLREVRDSKS